MLHNEKIRHVIDTVTSKVVLILGRFTEERKSVLDAIREELRRHDLVPVMFDFSASGAQELLGTPSAHGRGGPRSGRIRVFDPTRLLLGATSGKGKS
jgi:hypothetical protein